jgi:nickel-dependent lactate racemase
MLLYDRGSPTDVLTERDVREAMTAVFAALGDRRRVLAIPPDHTRIHSQAGLLTRIAYEHYGDRLTDVLPALGTHSPMTPHQLREMFGDVPLDRFRVHDWRNDVVTVGEIPAEFVSAESEGKIRTPMKAQVNRLLVEGGHDLILSIGQVVPHEVIGMANHNKNIFVGTGGPDAINNTHYLGAVYGMERIMGRAQTPVRRVLNYASEHFARDLPIVYVLTVIGRDASGALVLRGLFIGDDDECFRRAAALSLQVNFEMLEAPLRKVVVHLDAAEYKSTWLGNKSIYRTRMAIADGGTLVVLAPGLREFGEDRQIDALIRKYGYVHTPAVLRAVAENADLRENLSAAAHLIHGTSEGRFKIVYCPGHLTREEIEGVGYEYGDLDEMRARYNPDVLTDGVNRMPDGEEVYYISQPGLGLWAYRGRFS